MTLPSWWQVTTPHKDIRDGKLSEAIFAADLGDVFIGKAPLEYQDASIFFQKTYLTQGLKNLIENVLSRLKGGKGDPVIQLQTPFGGGKTHALLTLYHAIRNRKEIGHLPIASELPEIKTAKVAVFVGTHADAISGKTPWGEIASQLGQYDVIKDHDKKRIAPGKAKLRQVLEAAGPTLILMDELLEYIVKANRAEKVEKITQGQTLAFLQELSELVASSKDCSLVITLPGSILERYDEEAERSLQQLQKISGRVEAVYIPVEGIELYEVIRTRLFENLGDEKTRKQVAQGYFDLYQGLGTDVPSEARDIEYRDRIQRAYPFHPELIDVLYERWGSYPTFQRTRGVLRLLAEVVSDLYRKKTVSPLIHSSLVNLENQSTRGEFVKHIGNEYDSVIAADISGKNAKSPKIDKEMGSEYEKYGIAKGIATSVFINSFSAGASKETTLPRIRVSLLREGIPVTIVGDAVAKLEEELWYFHSERKQSPRKELNKSLKLMFKIILEKPLKFTFGQRIHQMFQTIRT
jgi:predicted AAA+ superfamily ATPase